jgi:hypothetical protein
MDNSFFEYLQQLELMAFFSGYPLLYAIIVFIAGQTRMKNNFTKRLVSVLPFAYALLGTLYLGYLLKNLYPDYSVKNIKALIQQPYLVAWGLISILFWIPGLAKKKALSLLHSLVFFFLLVRDLFLQLSASSDKSIITNDMNVYTNSILLNLGALALIFLLSFLFPRCKEHIRY